MDTLYSQSRMLMKPLSKKLSPTLLINKDIGHKYYGYGDSKHVNKIASESSLWQSFYSPYEIVGTGKNNLIILSSVEYSDLTQVPYYYFKQTVKDHAERYCRAKDEDKPDVLNSVMNCMIHQLTTNFLWKSANDFCEFRPGYTKNNDGNDISRLLTSFRIFAETSNVEVDPNLIIDRIEPVYPAIARIMRDQYDTMSKHFYDLDYNELN